MLDGLSGLFQFVFRFGQSFFGSRIIIFFSHYSTWYYHLTYPDLRIFPLGEYS